MNVLANGAQSATVGTKHQLHTTTANGVYMLMVDTTNLVNGDALELYIDVGFATGVAHVQTHYSIFANVQDDPGKVSVPVVAPYGATFSLKQTTGVSRSFVWCVTTG